MFPKSAVLINHFIFKFYYVFDVLWMFRSVLNTMGSQVDWDVKVRIVEHITEGLVYLHSQGVFHLHLKASNVLLDDYYNAMVRKVYSIEYSL